MLRLLAYRPDGGVSDLAPDDAKAALAEPDVVVWADLTGQTPESDALLADVFGFHPLAIEDVYKERHRPKVEDYDDYLYIIFRGLEEGDQPLEALRTVELDLFFAGKFVVTHHSTPMPALESSWEAVRKGRYVDKGPVFVAHAILDRLVDSFLPIGDEYAKEIDRIEDRILDGKDELARILELRGALHKVRRLSLSHRDVLGSLARAEFDEVPVQAKPFFRDAHEHMIGFVEAIEIERDELNAVFEAFHSLSAHRMNEIMKVLTLISTIVLPLTFLTGLYGMNFDNMPELHIKYAYFALLALMASIVLGMSLFFRRRGWL